MKCAAAKGGDAAPVSPSAARRGQTYAAVRKILAPQCCGAVAALFLLADRSAPVVSIGTNDAACTDMRIFLLFCACSLGCASVTAVGGPIEHERLHDGVFGGSAEHINKATVRLVVENQRVTSVRLETFDASPFGRKARDPIPRRILEQQSTKVDVVSGATEASNVIMNAAEAAVRKSYANLKQ